MEPRQRPPSRTINHKTRTTQLAKVRGIHSARESRMDLSRGETHKMPMKVLAKGKIGPAPFSFRRAVNGGGIERECARITSQAAASAAAAAITLSPFWGIESDGGNPTAKSRSAVGRRRTAPSASSLATRESLRRCPCVVSAGEVRRRRPRPVAHSHSLTPITPLLYTHGWNEKRRERRNIALSV